MLVYNVIVLPTLTTNAAPVVVVDFADVPLCVATFSERTLSRSRCGQRSLHHAISRAGKVVAKAAATATMMPATGICTKLLK